MEPLGQAEVPVPVPVAQPRLLGGSPLAQPVQPVPADRLQQPVARPVPGLLPAQHRLADQPGEQVEQVAVRVLDHVPGGGQPEAVGEHRQAQPERLLAGRAQGEAPVEGGLQPPVPGGYRVPGLQQPQVLVQPAGQLAEREGTQLGRGQLDGQREPVEPVADLRHDRPVVGVQREPGAYRHRALQEQRQSRVPGLGARWQRPVRIGDVQRHHVPHVLGHHPEHLPAGAQHPQAGAGAQGPVGEHRAGVHQVLAVVQYQQQIPVAQVVRNHLGERPFAVHVDAERVGDGVLQQGGLGHPGEVDQPDAVGERAPQLTGGPHGEPALSAATHAGQGHQARAGQQPPYLGDVPASADERRHLGGDPTNPVARPTTRSHLALTLGRPPE
jgi:hypothetical protein